MSKIGFLAVAKVVILYIENEFIVCVQLQALSVRQPICIRNEESGLQKSEPL